MNPFHSTQGADGRGPGNEAKAAQTVREEWADVDVAGCRALAPYTVIFWTLAEDVLSSIDSGPARQHTMLIGPFCGFVTGQLKD